MEMSSIVGVGPQYTGGSVESSKAGDSKDKLAKDEIEGGIGVVKEDLKY